MTRLHLTRMLLAACSMFLCLPTAFGQATGRPNPEAGPTVIKARIVALDVDEISSANQTFTANVFYRLRWQDDRLAHDGAGPKMIPVSEAWTPNFQFTNQQKVIKTFPEQLSVSPSGEVIYRQRVWGPFSQRLWLTDFPFDRQRFEILLAAADPYATSEDLVMVQDDQGASGLAPAFSLPDWDIDSWEADTTVYNPLNEEQATPGFYFAFHARRHVGYYVFKIMLPLLLIVMMSWIVFWVDPTEMGTQISVSVTSMLTLIAYRFMVGGALPTISYLTRMDMFILCATLLVFTTLMEAVVTGTLARRDRLDLARRIDRVARMVFPVAMILVLFATLVV